MSPIASNVKLTKTLRTVALLAAIALAAALGACSAPPAQEKAQQAQPEPLVVNDTPAPPVARPRVHPRHRRRLLGRVHAGPRRPHDAHAPGFERNQISLVTVPRDTKYVAPDGGVSKLNQVYCDQGPRSPVRRGFRASRAWT